MALIKHIVLNISLLLVIDSIWLKFVAGSFFANQLKEIGRFNSSGGFDVRLGAAVGAYVLMGLALELFIFRNQSLSSLGEYLIHGFLLGLCLYGVFDFTNRAIIEHYPMKMVIVDILWGSVLYTIVTYINFELRHRLTFL